MSFPNTIFLDFGQEKRASTVKSHPVGTRGVTRDGRVYHYALANGAIRSGVAVEHKAGDGTVYGLDVAVGSAAATDAQSVYLVSLSTVAITKDQWADGFLNVQDGTGEGKTHKVLGHAVTAVGSSLRVNLYPNDKIDEALTTSSLVNLAYGDYYDVNESSAASANGRVDLIMGVAPVEVADNEYFWCQTWGHCSALVSGTAIVGKGAESATVDGAFGPQTIGAVSSAILEQQLGMWLNPIVTTTDYGKLMLTINP